MKENYRLLKEDNYDAKSEHSLKSLGTTSFLYTKRLLGGTEVNMDPSFKNVFKNSEVQSSASQNFGCRPDTFRPQDE